MKEFGPLGGRSWCPPGSANGYLSPWYTYPSLEYPTPIQGTLPRSDILPQYPTNCYWHLVVLTRDLFKLVELKTYTPSTGTDI